jgi:DHA2 family multidrug resistance protein
VIAGLIELGRLMAGNVTAEETASVLQSERDLRPRRLLITCGLSLATALQAADALIANVALPKLEADLGSGIELGVWIITSYLCATAVVAPLTGRLRRRYGPRQLFFFAMGGFVTGSLLCAGATSGGAIIAFRILQGAGGGLLHPLAQAILLDLYPKERHGRVMAIWGAALMLGPILGPVIGGVITDLSSWRWVFVINLPLGVLASCCLLPLHTPNDGRQKDAIDPIGVFLLMIGVGALQLFLQRAPAHSWFRSPEIVVEAIVTVLSFALLGARVPYSGFTVFRPQIFNDVNFSTAAFYNFMNSALLFVTVVFIPLLAQGPLGLPATAAGALIMPRAILLMIVMLSTGRLIGRIDDRILLASGWVLSAAGLMILSTIEPDSRFLPIVLGSLVQSLGAGILYIPLATLAFSSLPPEVRTDATGLYSLLRQLAYASGVALMAAILQSKTLSHLDAIGAGTALARETAELNAYRDCFRAMSVVSLLIIPGIFLFRLPARRQPPLSA